MPKPQPSSKPVRLKLQADYRQIHLLDDGRSPDLGAAWTVQATEDRLAVADGGLGVGTESEDEVAVEIAVLAAEPARPAADHLTEASLELRSGRLVALGCTDYLPDARRLPAAPGWYRLRVAHTGLARKKERIRIALWPAPAAEPCVLTRWAPPPPRRAKPKPPRAPKDARQAAHAARRGLLEVAQPVLTALADAGDVAASASLAEILAFQGDWAGFVPRAEALLACPSAVRAGNVFTDLTRLLRRAARELGTPEILERAAARVPPRFHPMRDATLLKDLVLPSERIAEATEPERAAFQAALAQPSTVKRFAGHPVELGRHAFALASAFHLEDEILRRWEEVGDGLLFDQALTVARWHAFRGRAEQAWAVVEGWLPRWWPMDSAQVAPVILLIDPLLAALLTPERCAQVLSTPRGADE